MSQGNIVTEACLERLPVGKFVRFDEVIDMDGRSREVVIWRTVRNHFVANSAFDVADGEYLGEE